MADIPLLKSPVPVAEIDATGTPDATTYLRGDGAWETPPSGGGGSDVLATVEYNPATVAASTRSSTTPADVDATNLALTFTAPASGVVLVELEAVCQVSATTAAAYWNLRDASGDIAGTKLTATSLAALNRQRASIRVPGLTPGNSYTWKWGHAASSGQTSTVQYGQSTNTGPARMIVRSWT